MKLKIIFWLWESNCSVFDIFSFLPLFYLVIHGYSAKSLVALTLSAFWLLKMSILLKCSVATTAHMRP